MDTKRGIILQIESKDGRRGWEGRTVLTIYFILVEIGKQSS